MRGSGLVGTALTIVVVAGTAQTDASPRVFGLERLAADATLGIGGAIAFAQNVNPESHTADGRFVWPAFSAGFGLGWQIADSVAVMVRAKGTFATGPDDNDSLLFPFLGAGARLRLDPNTCFHAALGVRLALPLNDRFAEAGAITALLRIERFDGPVGFGLEATPHLFNPEDRNPMRMFDLMLIVAVRR